MLKKAVREEQAQKTAIEVRNFIYNLGMWVAMHTIEWHVRGIL